MKLHLKDYLTLANAACGFTAMILYPHFGFAPSAFLILVAALFDFLDGKAARRDNAHNEFGMHLDSLADAVSFAVAPAYLVSQAVPALSVWLGAVFFIMAGLLRLARHNVQEEKSHYRGLPIPIAAIALVLLALPLSLASHLLTALYAFALGALMLSGIRFKKL